MNDEATRSLDDVLAEMAVSGTDPAPVGEHAMELIARRSRRLRIVGGSAAMLVVAATTVIAVTGNHEPGTDEVVSPADPVTTTEAPATSRHKSTTTAPASTTPLSTVPATTSTTTPAGLSPTPSPVASSPPPTTATTAPTVPPSTVAEQPGSGTLTVSSGAAGDMLDLVFEFDDPDGPGGNPSISVATDEPGTPPLPQDMTGPPGGCDAGPGTTVRLRDRVQFASTGSRTVRIALKYCAGPVRVFNTTVQVSDPNFGDGGGRAVMAELPGPARPLERSRWEFLADDGRVLRVDPPSGSVVHDLGSQGGSPVLGVVVVLPAGTTGSPTVGNLVLISGGVRYSGRVDSPPGPGGSATRVPMALSGAAD